MAARSASGCSCISLSMKCSKPPFSAASSDQSMIETTRSRGAPSTPVIVTPAGWRSTTSPSSRKITRSRVGEDRRHVAGEERLAVADAHDEGHVHPRADQAVVLALVHDCEGVGAFDLAQGRPGGLGDVAVVGLLDEVGDRLGVGVGTQRVAALGQPVAELAEVLDDPVVDDRDSPRAVDVRVGIEVVGPAVGRPTGVGQADGRVGSAVRDRRLEVDELAGPLLDEHVAALVDEGDPGRVVAAVLEAFAGPR